jgi:hypothetical protein
VLLNSPKRYVDSRYTKIHTADLGLSSLSSNAGKGLVQTKLHPTNLTEMGISASELERGSSIPPALTPDTDYQWCSWWLNPLFAHHAGIIDLDSTEGGVCYDKYGAYALLMKDIGEIEASSERGFTYRCSQDDKGRFRLTSAVPRSRRPIRILRSHTLNSIWGPKAGVRYEGL